MQADLPGSVFARSFGAEAARYAAVRPTYPPAAIDFALGDISGVILDLGAGTGKLTAGLLERAGELIAVEPDAQMRAELRRAVPQARVLDGSAERIPLPDRSVDAILVGQAFHWFARPTADQEMARVLRPGGVVGLLWNFPDRTVDWVAQFYQATQDPTPITGDHPANLDLELFTPAAESWVGWQYELAGAAQLRELAHTWSWVITRSAAEKAAIDRRLRLLIDRHAELQGPVVRFPQRTKTVRQYRR
ncbi:MAG TPA: class I SAM-dependent methyltransferase [Jatrophihabitans sp.]|nr:class I SAM-dependent methyltransferase [Jatrophihabitans sp.]